MDGGAVEFVVRAKDEATSVIRNVTSELFNMKGGILEAAAAFGPYGKAAVALVAVSASLVTAGVALADNVEKLEQTSRRLGITIEQYQLLKMAMDDAGAGTAGLAVAIQKMNKAIGDGNKTLKELHIDTRDTYDAFTQFVQILAATEDQGTRTALAVSVFGKGAGDIIGAIEPLAEQLDKTADRAQRFGNIISTDMISKTNELNDNLDDLKAAWSGLMVAFGELGIGIATKVIEGLTGIVNGIREIMVEINKNEKAWNDFWSVVKDPVGSVARTVNSRMAAQNGVTLGPDGMPIQETSKQPFKRDPTDAELFQQYLRGLSNVYAMTNSNTIFRGNRDVSGSKSDDFWKNFGDATEKADKHFRDIVSSMKEVKVPALDFTMVIEELGFSIQQSLDRTKAAMEASKRIIEASQMSIASNISSAVRSIISGTQTIGDAFRSLVGSIMADIATAAAEQGIGLGLMAIGLAVGGPVGAFIGGVGGKLTGGTSAKQASGGDTFVIQTINAKDVVQSILSPTGSFRNANDRVRELAVVY